MKKFSRLFTLCLLATFVSFSGIHARTLLIIKSSKIPLLTEERNVSGFKGISSSGSYDIKISMGNKESLKLEGDVETISDIETVVENGVLMVRYKPRTGLRGRKKVNILINAKTIESLSMSGSGSLKVEGTLKSKNLKTQVSGSGLISLTAEATDYIAVLSGSGKIIVKGKVKEAQIVLSGSGNFSGEDLDSENAEVKVSGSGNASISADNTLEAIVSGSGSIRYSGNAEVTKSKSGSGSIIRM